MEWGQVCGCERVRERDEVLDVWSQWFALHPLKQSGGGPGLDYQLVVLLLDSQEALARGGDIDQPSFFVRKGLVEELDEVAVVSSVVSLGKLMHSGG